MAIRTRRLLFGLSKITYKDNPHVVQKLLEEVAASFTRLFHEGILLTNGRRVYAALLGVKGDFDFHAVYFCLERCYSKVITRHGVGHICHMCNAATGIIAPGINASPFEDFAASPQWRHSLFQVRPWETPAHLATIPYDAQGAQERMLLPDPFHIVKLGIARDLVGGIVVILCRKGFFDHDGCSKNIEQRFERAHSSFVLWASVSRERPALRSFTKAFFHMQNLMSAPWSNSKGGDSMILLRWIRWFLSLNLLQPVVMGFRGLLTIMLQTCEAILAFCRSLHQHGLFMHRTCANYMYVQLMRTLRGYKLLSQRAILLGMRAFVLKPKSHGLHHIGYFLKTQMESGTPLILNPESSATEVNEDFIGRVSRLSRKVGAQVMDLRVIQRVFLKTRALQTKRKQARCKQRV